MALAKLLLFLVSAGALICLIAFSLRRERTQAEAAKQARQDLIATNDLEDAYVSGVNGSLIGLSLASGHIVIGAVDQHRRVPVGSIRTVEGVRNGVVLVRTDKDGWASASSAADTTVTSPLRVHSLGLRVTVDAPELQEHFIVFADGGKIGLEPSNIYLRQQAAETEVWFRKLSAAMQSS